MKIITTFTRPAEDVEFFKDQEFTDYLMESYVKTGKFVVTSVTEGLVKTTTVVGSIEDCAAFKNDTAVKLFKKTRDKYNLLNGITVVVKADE